MQCDCNIYQLPLTEDVYHDAWAKCGYLGSGRRALQNCAVVERASVYQKDEWICRIHRYTVAAHDSGYHRVSVGRQR